MIVRPRLKSYYQVEILAGKGVLLLDGSRSILLRGALLEHIIPLIDGQRSVDEIITALPQEVDPIQAHYTLLRLEQEQHITEAPSAAIPAGIDHFWQRLNVDVQAAWVQFQLARIHCINLTRHAIDQLEDLWPAERLDSEASNASFHIVLAEDYLDPRIDEINRHNFSAQRPWLLIRPGTASSWVGPLFVPDHTGCYACLKQRLRMHRTLPALAEQHDRTVRSAPVEHLLDSHLTPLLHEAYLATLRWFGEGHAHPLIGNLRSTDYFKEEVLHHTLTRRPQCEVCGNPSVVTPTAQSAKALLGNASNQTFNQEATTGFRSTHPSTTFSKYRHHISPITGIVRQLRHQMPDINTIHVFSAGHNLHPISDREDNLPRYLRDQSSGKGTTPLEAKTSALCEALERYSGVFQGHEVHRTASYEALGHVAIHPNDYMGFSDAQYEHRDAWHAACSHGFQHVPIRFDPSAEIHWTQVWSLSNGEARYVPTGLCYYHHKGPGNDMLVVDSNGNAAGNTLDEAFLQGFFELVERDAVAMWWYNRLQRPAVDLSSFGISYLNAVTNYYAEVEREVTVLDLTTDFGIPVFCAWSRQTAGAEQITMGFGAHLDPRVALVRSVTEMNQLLPFIQLPTQEPRRSVFEEGSLEHSWFNRHTVQSDPYLLPAKNLPGRTADSYSNASLTLPDATRACLKQAKELGLEVLILDQTRPDIGLPVVKVIAPGLRVFWKRLAPGRLYDVPVKLGWTPSPTAETEMNPFPFFL